MEDYLGIKKIVFQKNFNLLFVKEVIFITIKDKNLGFSSLNVNNYIMLKPFITKWKFSISSGIIKMNTVMKLGLFLSFLSFNSYVFSDKHFCCCSNYQVKKK